MRAILFIALLPVLHAQAAWSHETTQTCDSSAAKQPAIQTARSELKQKPRSAGTRTNLADRLIEAGCYDEAVHVLEDGVKLFPADRSLQTRLNTARSYIGEREYLEKQTLASDVSEAAFLRQQLRCKQIGDQQACDQALASKPNDAALWAAKGDALLKEKRSRDALQAFSRAQQVAATSPQAAAIDLNSRISAAQALLAAQSPPSIVAMTKTNAAPAIQSSPRTTTVKPAAPTFSNLEPASRSN